MHGQYIRSMDRQLVCGAGMFLWLLRGDREGRTESGIIAAQDQALQTKCHGNHGNIKAYLYRFKIIEAPNCPSGNDNHTAEHILLECTILKEDRERLIAAVAKAETASVV